MVKANELKRLELKFALIIQGAMIEQYGNIFNTIEYGKCPWYIKYSEMNKFDSAFLVALHKEDRNKTILD